MPECLTIMLTSSPVSATSWAGTRHVVVVYGRYGNTDQLRLVACWSHLTREPVLVGTEGFHFTRYLPYFRMQLFRPVSRPRLRLSTLAPSRFLIIVYLSPVDIQDTFSQYTTLQMTRLCCGIGSIPCL
jgi:hypothetical protein